MCNNQFNENSRADKKGCSVQKILESGKEFSDLYFDLIYDKDGECLFHSKDLEWKKQNAFAKRFEQFLEIAIRNKASLQLLEFHFVSDLGELVIKEKTISKSLHFQNCVFHDSLIFKNVNIKSEFTIESSRFVKNLEIHNSEIDTIFFTNLSTTNVKFRDVNFNYGESRFTQVLCKKEFLFHKCKFENGVKFNKSKFTDDWVGHYDDHINVSFKDIHFRRSVDFSDVEFLGSLLFEKVIFDGGAKFNDTKFSFKRPLMFDEISVGEGQMIEFIGSAGKEKLFNSKVNFYRLQPENIKGQLIFENANFGNINAKHKDTLMALQKTGKVVIGVGCIKYRNQSPIKEIVLTPENQTLALELASTFIQFFKSENELNLGVEIVGKSEDFIRLFYFSDANITYEEFAERLTKSETEMWRLIKVEKQSIKTETPKTTLPAKIVAGTDTLINLSSIVLKMVARAPFGRFTQKELNSLMSTTSFGSNNQLGIDAITSVNINQTILLGIGNTQNANIEK